MKARSLYASLALLLLLAAQVHMHAQSLAEIQTILPDHPNAFAYFGFSVGISGNTAIVGAPHDGKDEQENNYLELAGAAYIFEKDSSGNWGLIKKLVPAIRVQGSNFGMDVAIQGDVFMVTSPGDNLDENGMNPMPGRGAIFVYEKDVFGDWIFRQKIVSGDRATSSGFGDGMDFYDDYLIVGASGVDVPPPVAQNTNVGAIYVFEQNSSGLWIQQQELFASDWEAHDRFGTSISVFEDQALIGAPGEDNDIGGTNLSSGAVYVIERGTNGTWMESTKLTEPIRERGNSFGNYIHLYDGTALIGVPRESQDDMNQNTLEVAGAVYIFEEQANGDWLHVKKLVAPDRDIEAGFGDAIAMNENLLLVGASQDKGNPAGGPPVTLGGAAYAYGKDHTGTWVFSEKFMAAERDEADLFGFSIALDDSVALISSFLREVDTVGAMYPLMQAGSAYIFTTCSSMEEFALSLESCSEYVSPSGEFIWQETGTYYDTLSNTAGCDSVLRFYLQIDTVNTEVELFHAVLTAQAQGDSVSYQWLDCNDDYLPILGATDSVFEPIGNGNYAVHISDNGCLDTSTCISVLSVGLLEEEGQTPVQLIPNPSDGHILVSLDQPYQHVSIVLQNMWGQQLSTDILHHQKDYQMTIDGPPGLYIMSIQIDNERNLIRRIVKK